ncbi:hypothetical protein GCM10027615_15380 [Plantactinospora veratri]
MLLPAEDDNLFADPQFTRSQVDVLPAQSRHLAPAWSPQRDQPPQHEQRVITYRFKKPRQVMQVPHRNPRTDAGCAPRRFLLVIPDHNMRPRAVRQPQIPGRVVTYHSLPPCLRQRASKHCAVSAHAPRRNQPSATNHRMGNHIHRPLDIPHTQLAQPVMPQMWDQVGPHAAAVVDHC